MTEPKFKRGQLIKYRVRDEVRYNHVLESVWNEAAGVYLYRLDEMMAMPVYRESWLCSVSEEEIAVLQEAIKNNMVVLHRMGYITLLE